MIDDAMLLRQSPHPESDGPDLSPIGLSKARTYRRGGPLVVVREDGAVAIVQGYRPGMSIAQCAPTCIQVRDLAGLALKLYGQCPDAAG